MHYKISSIALVIVGMVITFTACGSKVKNPPPPVYTGIHTIKINAEQELQTMDGFGASDAWRCQMVGKYWPEEKKNAIADMLFSSEVDEKGNPRGIGLSIWRFYLGAGSTEQGEESDIYDEWRRGECFQNPDGTYNWQKQEGQRWFLQAARKRGVEKYLAFTISPPVHMTINGKAFSPQKEYLNIKEGMLPRYADFLVDCIENLQKNEGITFNYLSPINEPQWDWMEKGNGKASQEGTPATNRELYDFTSLLSKKLSERKLNTTIALGEAAVINYLYEDVNNETRDNQVSDFWDPASPLCIASLPNVEQVITGHSYFSVWPVADQVEYRRKLNARIKQYPGLKYWQTEYCILEQPGESELPGGSGGKRDLGMQTAIFVARIIHNDLVVANASSWQWWTALTRADFKDGLIYLDDGNGTGSQDTGYCKYDGFARSSKLMWALGNYSFFIRPGMKRIQIENQNHEQAATNVMVSAYKDTSTGKLVIVAINASDKETTCKLDIDKKLKNNTLIPYITSETSNLQKGTAVSLDEMVIAPKSIVTFVGEME
ncbi:glycoside hydrolase [Bacteroides sp. 519]|uniref:glycoside hydrolase n=1 Tax=Bacteroides sp. 519 TaxID=2302937 RepID=UPI0013D58A0D|nr:glycoside hydrolase [Bacteroides sp. 519]NDV57852.1 glycosyl hydrolase [Bacteroides sp. 519]